MMVLPQTCEKALLERFLRAEAMALWAVRAAQMQNLPRHVQTFLQRHEIDGGLRQLVAHLFQLLLEVLHQRAAGLHGLQRDDLQVQLIHA